VKKQLIGLVNNFRFSLPIDYHKIIGKRDFIIMYHGVSAQKNNPYNKRHTYIKDFEKQIEFFAKKCNVISVKEFFSKNYQKDKCNIAITFDDGFKNNLTYAAPVLERYNVPASFYITGLKNTVHPYIWADFLQLATKERISPIVIGDHTFIKKNNDYFLKGEEINLLYFIKNIKPDYNTKLELYAVLKGDFEQIKNTTKEFWELLSDDDIVIIKKKHPKITIGSHGFLHNNLGNLNLNDAKEELKASKKYLEGLVGENIEEIAYPDGSYNRGVLESAAEIGFNYQLATEKFLNREDVNDNRILTRKGIYQIGSWASQIKFKF
jgi:peptidoglycan/xylan/chitin deacetylase (PgdA/CDA1 family)